MDLSDYMRENTLRRETPLAIRVCPQSLEKIAGQAHILNKDKLFYQAIKTDTIGPMILYGPSGCGKTTIAEVISRETQSDFCRLNVTTADKEEMEEVIQCVKENFGRGRRTTPLVDRIHRSHKRQQDFLFPYVEGGTVALIGTTTESPFFEINATLLSRSRIFGSKPPAVAGIAAPLRHAMADRERGYRDRNAVLMEEACAFLADAATGDARTALNALGLGMKTTTPESNDCISIALSVVEDCIQKRIIRYDKDGDNHYGTVSAFTKSIRGPDPDMAVHYLARMLCVGEDPRFLARRIVIRAAEGVDNADPMALVVAESMTAALNRADVPGGRLLLSQACLYVANAPKSNTTATATFSTLDFATQTTIAVIPPYLRGAHYTGHEKLGRDVGYRYPHDYPGNYVTQDYSPGTLRGTAFYTLSDNGRGAEIKACLAALKAAGKEKHGGRET